MKHIVLLIWLAMASLSCFAQNGNNYQKTFAFTGALASIPSTCSVGQVAFITDATAGQNIYECAVANTWTQQSGGGGAGAITTYTTDHTLSSSEVAFPCPTVVATSATSADFRITALSPIPTAGKCVNIINNSTHQVVVEPNSLNLGAYAMPFRVGPSSSVILTSDGSAGYYINYTKGPLEDQYVTVIRGQGANNLNKYSLDFEGGSGFNCPGSSDSTHCTVIAPINGSPPWWAHNTAASAGSTAYSNVSEGDFSYGALTYGGYQIRLTTTTLTATNYGVGFLGGVAATCSIFNGAQGGDDTPGCAGGQGAFGFMLHGNGGTDAQWKAVHASSSHTTRCSTGISAIDTNAHTVFMMYDKLSGTLYYLWDGALVCTSQTDLPSSTAYNYFTSYVTSKDTTAKTYQVGPSFMSFDHN